MTASSKSYAAHISNAQVMVAALRANLPTLQARGMTEAFVAELEAAMNAAIGKNNEQEQLRASFKSATAALNAHMKQVNAAVQEAAKVVKLAIPQAQWKEFGVAAKR